MRLDTSGGSADRGTNEDADHERDDVGGQHAPYGFSDANEFIGYHSWRLAAVPPTVSAGP